MLDLKRFEGESDEELIYRICSQKEQIGSWQDVADILNRLLNTEYTESKFRKQFQSFQKMLAANQSRFADSESQLEELRIERQLLEKEKVKFRDERNEYNRLIRQEARKESYIDLVKRVMSEYVPESIEYEKINKVEDNGNDLIIHVTDVHTGIKIDNFFNKFNTNVLKYRFNRYLDEIFEIRERHESQNAYVIIGEVVSGLIHENLRCENNQNLIEQFMTISNYLTEFLSELSKEFNEVNVYVTPGNHSRISPKKEQNLKGENFDHLLIPLLSARLQNNKVVHFHENKIEESIAMFGVRGKVVMSSHGDKDTPANVVQKFSLLFQTIPDLVYLGHRHSNGLSTVYNTKVIESGCISGADNYALDLRLRTSPEQTVSVVDEHGLVCLYDIQLDY